MPPPIRAASRLHAFGHAFAGLAYLMRTQPNARIHIAVTLAVTGLGLWLGLGRLDWAILGLAIGLVWTCECFNTAVESMVDLVSPELHPLARAGKDVAAAGVLIAAGVAALAGLLVLGPLLWARLAGG